MGTTLGKTIEEFEKKWQPLKTDDGQILLFESYGQDKDFLSKQDPCKVWTLIEGTGDYN